MNRLRTRVKICGITDAESARVAVEGGADALGFVFHRPSPRYIPPEHAAGIIRRLPAFVQAVGVVVDLGPAELDNIAKRSGIDCFQFHGDEGPEACAAAGLPFLKALRVKPNTDVRSLADRYTGAKGVLLDAFCEHLAGGTGARFDWSRIPGSFEAPLLLAGGLNADNVADAIHQVRPYGVDVSTGVERSPGVKEPDKIIEFLRTVMETDFKLQQARRTDS